MLNRDYILPDHAAPLLDVPGGSLLYTAVGASIWDSGIGLVGRVSADYPVEWLEEYNRRGWDVRGIKILSERLDLRCFTAYTSPITRDGKNPVSHFARCGVAFPRSLIGYQKSSKRSDDLNSLLPTSPRTNDYPSDYLLATAAHLCRMDYLTQNLLQPFFREGQINTITLRASSDYMLPENFTKIPTIISRLSVFFTSEEQIRSLFSGRTSDLWEMAARLTEPGCEIVVINRGIRGQMLYQAATGKKWIVPAYPSPVHNLTGAADAFCGGFLAGYRLTYDPLEACLRGNISASLVMDGAGPYYALDGIPGLSAARLDALRGFVQKVKSGASG